MKKTDFLKNGPSYILPTIKYVISEPHGDLLQCNLSWAFTFDFSVHQKGSASQLKILSFQHCNGLQHCTIASVYLHLHIFT